MFLLMFSSVRPYCGMFGLLAMCTCTAAIVDNALNLTSKYCLVWGAARRSVKFETGGVSIYANKPARLLTQLEPLVGSNPKAATFCAGFEIKRWRCDALAAHLMEWIADYALIEEELLVAHTSMYVRLREAAVRIYTSEKYKTRGEVGEIALHAICRDFFDTIPIAPRVFYLTASNDVVKSFDMVHVRYTTGELLELWLGESKLYEDSGDAIRAAIASVEMHIDQGFLNRQKLLLGPQISKSVPRYQEIRELLSSQSSLDALFKAAIFPVLIAAESEAVAAHEEHCPSYFAAASEELAQLAERLAKSDLPHKIEIVLIYMPLLSKEALADAFDAKLKGLGA
jgi:hypothetical protein